LVDILGNLNDANNNGYYRYDGSLAFPPCTEGVIWSVFRQTIPISASQVISYLYYVNFIVKNIIFLNKSLRVSIQTNLNQITDLFNH